MRRALINAAPLASELLEMSLKQQVRIAGMPDATFRSVLHSISSQNHNQQILALTPKRRIETRRKRATMKEDGATQNSTLSSRNTARRMAPSRSGNHRHSTHGGRHTLREVLAHHPPRLHSHFVGWQNQGIGLNLHEVIQQALDTITDFEREDGEDLSNDDEIRQA
jgi:hypothetical protein